MTKKELAEIIVYLFADHDAPLKPEKLQVWADQFCHLPPRVGWAAARLCNARKSYGLPKAQDYADAVREVLSPEGRKLTGAEAFALAYRAAGRFGSYRKDEGLRSLPPLVAKAADRFGWAELCMNENPEAIRGHFARTYDSMAEQHRTEIALPPALIREIASIRSEAAGQLPTGATKAIGERQA